MPKRNIEDLIATLGRLKDSDRADSTLASLRRGLTDRVNLVVAKAAQVAADMQLKPLIPDLVSTFDRDRKSTRLNSSHPSISYAVFCLKKKTYNTLFMFFFYIYSI